MKIETGHPVTADVRKYARDLDKIIAAAPEANLSTGHREIRAVVDTAPEAPAWQELSEDEVLDAYMGSPLDVDLHISELCAFASEISAALRAKNGATK